MLLNMPATVRFSGTGVNVVQGEEAEGAGYFVSMFPLRRNGTTNRTERKTQAEVVRPDCRRPA